jgi:hypothetical protein
MNVIFRAVMASHTISILKRDVSQYSEKKGQAVTLRGVLHLLASYKVPWMWLMKIIFDYQVFCMQYQEHWTPVIERAKYSNGVFHKSSAFMA